MQHLSVDTLLQGGKYKIEKVLGQGGFGITYLAKQVMLDREVCIKEFFFKEYCNRESTGYISASTDGNKEIVERFLSKFIKEARTISRLNHPNIVQILDIFEENGTAYYIMEYIDGCSLEEIANSHGVLSEGEAIGYIKQIANALDYIHQNRINHLDVKPANIMIRKSDNKAILIDFGVSKQYDIQGGQTSTTPVGISHGYAPMEQYNVGGVSTFTPQTDIYSLGATLYRLVTNTTPPPAVEILNDGLPQLPMTLSSWVKNAITNAMQVRKSDRPENISVFLNLLSNSCIMGSYTEACYHKNPQDKQDESTKILGGQETKEKTHQYQHVDNTPQPKVLIVDEKENNKKKNYIWYVLLFAIIGLISFLTLGNNTSGVLNTSAVAEKTTHSPTSTPAKQPGFATHEVATAPSNTSSINKPSHSNNDGGNKDKYGICNNKTVDLGLSVLWAGWNVGASTPEGYGGLYQPTNFPTKSWSGWRLPTDAEFEELKSLCKWTWIDYRGVRGVKIVGPNGNAIFMPASGLRDNDNVIIHRNLYGGYWSSDLSSSATGGSYYMQFDDFSDKTDEEGYPLVEYGYYRYLDKSIRLVYE